LQRNVNKHLTNQLQFYHNKKLKSRESYYSCINVLTNSVIEKF